MTWERVKAKAAGRKTYRGRPCSECGRVQRLVYNFCCSYCSNAKRRARRLKGSTVDKAVAHNKKNPKRRKFTSKKADALAKGIEFTLTMTDVHWPDTCPVLGIPLDYRVDVRGRRNCADNSPSFARIDPSKGYVPGNVEILSLLANRIMTNATADQVMRVAKYMQREK